MNRKRTNYLVAILNIVIIASMYILIFSDDYLMKSMIGLQGDAKSIYNSGIIDALINNFHIIMVSVYSGVGIINIICAIQNKENKKLSFWQLVFGIYGIFSALSTEVITNCYDISEWINKVAFGVIPIILVLISLLLKKKNKKKIKVINIIAHIAFILLAVLNLSNIICGYWDIVAIIMQLIYIYFQEKDIIESKTRKTVNVILYYILQTIVAIIFSMMVISSVLITMINNIKLKNQLSETFNNIVTMERITDEEIYIPVEKNKKYGFINESGQEKIACEYDLVSFFECGEINNHKYYFALAKKADEYYIISKSNQKLNVNNQILKRLDDITGKELRKGFNREKDARNGYVWSLTFVLQVFTSKYLDSPKEQFIEKNISNNKIYLQEENLKIYYKNENILLEKIENENNNEYNYENDLSINAYKRFRITTRKNNGEENSSIVYIPLYNDYDKSLEIFEDGSIEFESIDGKTHGWYDKNGNIVSISADYEIRYVLDNVVLLEKFNINPQYFLLNKSGKLILKSDGIEIFDNIILIKKENKQMMLYDKNLNEISNEYDRIIVNQSIDISENFSSYN